MKIIINKAIGVDNMRFDDNVDVILGYHAAPTFEGIKPSSVISFNKKKLKNLRRILREHKVCLQCKGIHFFVLSETENWLLLLVYREKALENILHAPEIHEFMQQFGYDKCHTLTQYLRQLKNRMVLQKGFPHEIGVFLGYPLGDVKGFIENNGKHFKISGQWKVYDNPEEAESLFARYAECSHRFCCSIMAGASIRDLAKAI